jgi:hypothetical protein
VASPGSDKLTVVAMATIFIRRKEMVQGTDALPAIADAGAARAPVTAPVIRSFCITILYHNLLLFIDIFHI